MNQTLEAMAQALFQSWFVDFDPVIDKALANGKEIPGELSHRVEVRKKAREEFPELFNQYSDLFPDSFHFTEELGWIPEGWKSGKITDLAKLNAESWTTRNHPDSIIYVDLANTKNGQINEFTNYEYKKAPSRARRVTRKHDTIIGTVRPGNRSFAYIQEEGLTVSTGFAVLRPKAAFSRSFVYLRLTQDEVINELAKLADGAAYPAVRPDVVGNIRVTIPNEIYLEKFEHICSSFTEKISTNAANSRILKQLRDTLLPKLISGEIDVSEFESTVSEHL